MDRVMLMIGAVFALFIAVFFMGVVLVLGHNKKSEWAEKCVALGGVPLQPRSGPSACVARSAVINVPKE